MSSLNQWQVVIGTWATATFKHNEYGIVKHLIREAVELARSIGLSDADIQASVRTALEKPAKATAPSVETADVTILALALAYHLDYDLEDAVCTKHLINKGRTWGTPDHEGVTEHVEEVPA